MAKRYRRTGRRTRTGKKSRGKLRRKRTQRPRRMSKRLFMRGGTSPSTSDDISLPRSETTILENRALPRESDLGGAMIINSSNSDVSVRGGFRESDGTFIVAKGNQYNNYNNEFPPLVIQPNGIRGIDQGMNPPSSDHKRALEIMINNQPKVVERVYRDIFEITQDGGVKRGSVKADTPSLDAMMGRDRLLSYVDGNMENV